jgi:hypothetical protein
MRQVKTSEIHEELAFVKMAAKYFSENKQCHTFTKKDITTGCLFAVRWGLLDDCVVVLRLDDNHEPKIYANVIKREENANV